MYPPGSTYGRSRDTGNSEADVSLLSIGIGDLSTVIAETRDSTITIDHG